MNDLRKEVEHLIEGCTGHLGFTITQYAALNQHVKIIDDGLAEAIHAKVHRTRCCGSGGSGWDTDDKGESKVSCWVQSKFCALCDEKVVFFRATCPSCASAEFKASRNQKRPGKTNPRDGRWGISAKTHFKYFDELNEYRLMLVEPEEDSHTCRRFRIRYWALDKRSEYFNKYAKAQRESNKSDHMNFQPLKKDFYLSGPALRFDGWLTVVNPFETKMEFNIFDPDNTVSENLPEEFSNLNLAESVKNKNFGKRRGKVRRN